MVEDHLSRTFSLLSWQIKNEIKDAFTDYIISIPFKCCLISILFELNHLNWGPLS